MKKWIMLLILMVSPLAARIGFESRVAVLYWKPTTGGLNLGMIDNQVVLLRPHHHVGFMVAPKLVCGCVFLEAEYTYGAHATDRRKINKDVTRPFGGTGPLTASQQFDYQTLVFRLGYRFFDRDQFRASLFASVEGMYGEMESRISPSFRERARYRGLGPGLGIEGDFFLCNGLGAVARIGTNVVVGEREYDMRGKLYPSECALLPAFNARLSLAYKKCCKWGEFTFELGYEVRHYPNAFVQGISRNGTLVPELRDLTVGGAFFAFSIRS